MCDNDLLQMLAINIPQRWMRATFSWLTRASDQATLTLAHCNLETMGMYTRTSISTKDVKLNLEQIQKPETLQPLKPSETYLVTSCHILSHLVTTSSVSGMQRHRRRHMRPPARPERHCTDLTPLNALAEPSVIPHEHLACMNLSHKMSQDVSIEFHWYISIHPGPVLPISPSIQRMLTCSRSANSLQDTTSAMAIQPPQWSRLYI